MSIIYLNPIEKLDISDIEQLRSVMLILLSYIWSLEIEHEILRNNVYAVCQIFTHIESLCVHIKSDEVLFKFVNGVKYLEYIGKIL
jgi:hypothetical protein